LTTAAPPDLTPSPRKRLGRDRILAAIREAAIEEFSLHGLRGASTQSIAERAGLTKPQLHYYIHGKDELYEELLESVLEGWSYAFAFDENVVDPKRVLSDYVRKKLDYALDNPGLSRIFTGELLAGGAHLDKYWPRALASTDQKVRLIEGWMQRGLIQQVDARLLLMQIWAMTQHYADYNVQARVMLHLPANAPIDRAPIARQITNSVLLLCGLAPD